MLPGIQEGQEFFGKGEWFELGEWASPADASTGQVNDGWGGG